MIMKASLYIHIPFCRSKCRYCDFESYAGREERAHEYVSRVIEEAVRCREEYGAFGVPSVYIGGGTPSCICAEETKRLLRSLSDLFSFDKDCEITTEANPGTVDYEKLLAYRKAGINRISFGAQAAQVEILKSLGRIHTWKEAGDAVKMSRDAGIDNVNIDLMYALPGQSEEDFVSSVEKAVRLGVTHLSLYSLILEEGTPLYESAARGDVLIPGDDESVNMQEKALEFLSGTSFKRYEISNYAICGYECRHNIVYWTRDNYLGLGCGAHSLMNDVRFFNPRFEEYMCGSIHPGREEIGREDRMEESIMLETRMTRGLDLLKFEKSFGREARNKVVKSAKPLIDGGLANLSEDRLFFTKRGLDIQNALVVRLLESI